MDFKLLFDHLNTTRNELNSPLANIADTKDKLSRCIALHHEVIQKIWEFQYYQQKAIDGAPEQYNLDLVQSWFQTLQSICQIMCDIWLFFREKLQSIVTSYPEEGDFRKMRQYVDNMIEHIVNVTFIVEKQPPQVLKTNSRFSTIVRSLIGGLISSKTDVEISIINESQARILQQSSDNSLFKLTSGVILNRESKSEWQATTSESIVYFRNLTLQKINRSEKKGYESVTDEKFAILFQTRITLTRSEIVYNVKTLSLPMVVIVHGTQETAAWATITWDNEFASPDRLPFTVPMKVPWDRVGQILSNKFHTCVGCGLTVEDLNFLAGKVFTDFNSLSCDQLDLTWAKFAKKPLPGCDFTFWEWFYSILKLTRDHLKDLWRPDKRLIRGFIGRKQTEDALINKPIGTFLLRYSETSYGCISIAFKAADKTVQHIAPFSTKELKDRSLPHRINDLGFKYLYPDIPKDQAFSEFYKPIQNIEPASKTYITTELAARQLVPTNSFASSSNTPHFNIINNSQSIPIHNVESIDSLTDFGCSNMNDLDVYMDGSPGLPSDLDELLKIIF